MGSILVSGRCPWGGNDNPFQYSCLENSMDKGAWQTTVYAVTKSQTQLSMHAYMQINTQMHLFKNGYLMEHIMQNPHAFKAKTGDFHCIWAMVGCFRVCPHVWRHHSVHLPWQDVYGNAGKALGSTWKRGGQVTLDTDHSGCSNGRGEPGVQKRNCAASRSSVLTLGLPEKVLEMPKRA